MKIAIDATNIKAGGGLTHLKQIVENNKSEDVELTLIGGKWLENIKDSILTKKMIYEDEFADIPKQEFFKKFKLPKLLEKFEIALIPGGTFYSKKINYVSMSQNMLIFEEKERNRFPFSFNWFRYIILEKLQLKSFKDAKGIIYISNYAKVYIENKYPLLKNKKSKVIYHGISNEFRQEPKLQQPINEYTKENPYVISYISIINFYKHQWNVVEAVKKLRSEGYYIKLNLIGSMNPSCKEKLENSIKGAEDFIFYEGHVPYNEISNHYKSTNLFVFASTCENMPNILLEAMSAGLPILSSDFGPMPEILKDAGVYMNPTSIHSIYENLKKMVLNEDLRKEISEKAYEYSKDFSWERTANETFTFLKEIALENKK